MALSATQTQTITQPKYAFQIPEKVGVAAPSTEYHIPLQLSGALDQYEQNDLTPIIGTQFENINLAEILHSRECDQKIRDIAITSEYKPFNWTETSFF